MTVQSKHSLRLFSFLLVLAVLIAAVPALVSTSNTKADSSRRLGAWWWSFSDATNTTTRNNYLNALEAAGVNEIYLEAYPQLWTASNHAQLHTFIQAAMSHGMRVSIMMDDPDLATNSSSSKNYIQKLYTGYVTYKASYPDDWLYGLHFDVEPGGYNTSVLQNYCNNLLQNAITYLINNGIYCEFDVNPAWNGYAGVSFNGVSDFYRILAHELGNGKGCICFMSYRTTAAKIVSRANEKNGIDYCKTYNTDYTCGIETDNVESGVDVHDKSKQQVQEIILDVFDLLDAKEVNSNYGFSIHHAATYYGLSGSVSNPSHYSGGGQPTYTTVTGGGQTSSSSSSSTTSTNATTTTTQPVVVGNLVRHVIWSGDLDTTVQISNYVAMMNNAEINAALQAEFTENGYPVGDEYYEIITTGHVSGNSGYAVAGIYNDNPYVEIWAKANAEGCSTIGISNGTYTQKIFSDATDKQNNLLCPQLTNQLCLMFCSDADGYTDTVTITHFEIAVYRVEEATSSNNSSNTSGGSTVKLGDANGDDAVDMKDVLLVRKAVAGLPITETYIEFCADTNSDNLTDMKDVLAIRKHVAGVLDLGTAVYSG